MIFLRVIFLSFTISIILSFGGTVRQLPALPNGAVAHALQMGGDIYVAGSIAPKNPRGTGVPNNGATPVRFQVPLSSSNIGMLTKLQVGGAAVRETSVGVCVVPHH